MPLKQSLYDITEHHRDVVTNKGFNYEGQLFKRTMSNFMFLEEKRSNILEKIEAVVFELIENTKNIKNHFNYIVPKNYRNKN